MCVLILLLVHFHQKMGKYYLFHLLCVAISLCNARGNIVCQSFDERTRSIKQYCERYDESAWPAYCVYEGLVRIDVTHVNRLNIGGCEPEIVLNSIELFQNVHTLDLSHSGYTTLNWLHNMTLRQLHRFNASHNALPYVFQLLKNTTPDVSELDLSFNQLMNIGAHTFGVIKNVQSIFLSHNRLKYISFDAFLNAEQLTFIDLRMNHFHEIPPIFDNEQQQLQTILLHGNPIERFNLCLLHVIRSTSLSFSWENVEHFWQSPQCHDKHLKPLPIVLNSDYEGILYATHGRREMHCNEYGLKNLKNFSAGQMESFESVVDLLYAFGSSVMHLDLSNNSIGKLTDTAIFEKFDRLTTLSLSNTQLTDFDLGTFNTQLTKLDLSFNRLKRIENASLMDEFMSLAIFNISGNRIENVHDLIEHMSPTIKWLDLGGNYVGALNANTFEELPSLRMLNLDDCHLSNFSDLKPFEMLRHLNVLNLSHNDCKNVNFSILPLFSMLSELYVAYCEIENISNVTRYLGESMRRLDLSGNHIASIYAHQAPFKTLINLEYLNMSNTKIITLDPRTFEYQFGLRVLDLSHNELQTIDLRWLNNNVEQLYLNENSLHTIENLDGTNHLRLNLLAIAQNQLSCQFLRGFVSHLRHITFVGDPVQQKHADPCRSSKQGVKDFLSSFYDTIKFW